MTDLTTDNCAMRTVRSVLIVDGHEGVRTALARRLARAPRLRAIPAADLAAALYLARELSPDAVVCDPKTLHGDPAMAVSGLAAQGAPVLVLTSSLRDGEADALEDAGAAALLLKGSAIAGLIAAIEAAIARGARAAPTPRLPV
jgi:DNA-binding NarL/FixJ family response regulator